jgi:two-component system chemotaxis response regulator CheB
VIAVVLSGTLDDGTAGMIKVRRRGGLGVVQDASEAPFSDMPESAARYGDPDHIVPVAKMPGLLADLAEERQLGAVRSRAGEEEELDRRSGHRPRRLSRREPRRR